MPAASARVTLPCIGRGSIASPLVSTIVLYEFGGSAAVPLRSSSSVALGPSPSGRRDGILPSAPEMEAVWVLFPNWPILKESHARRRARLVAPLMSNPEVVPFWYEQANCGSVA